MTITVSPSIQDFFNSRKNHPLTVLSGPNNHGKSLILKLTKKLLGIEAYYLGPLRFYSVSQIGSSLKNPNEANDLESQFNNMINQEDTNHDQNVLDLNRIIINMSDSKRDALFELTSKLLGVQKIDLKKVVDNKLSPHYVDIDGKNLSLSSTGTRLLMTILGTCMDDRYKYLFIDEPELGLSPKVQIALSSFLQNDEERKKYFPDLNNIFLATHSHLFLDRSKKENNFTVVKKGEEIEINQVTTTADFHKLQFNLLGNTMESFSLPSAIIIVEGPTDFRYIDRLIQLKFPDKKITVQSGQGDVKRNINIIKETFGDFFNTPYKHRLIVVLDSISSTGTEELKQMGVEEENIIKWDKNGIEYLYPANLMMAIFGCSKEDLSKLSLKDDLVCIEQNCKKKMELCEEILNRIDSSTDIPEELQDKLIGRITLITN